MPESYRERLSQAASLGEILEIVRRAARELMASDGATVVLREEGQCFYADEDSIAPLWKGQRFPLDQCISGWAMLHRDVAVIPDITLDPRIPQDAYRPTFVSSLVMVPLRQGDPLGAIGAYWARRYAATDEEVGRLQSLAEAAGAALERVGLAEAPWAPTFRRTEREPTAAFSA